MALLMVAGFSCCAAMSMPQVHIVAYCGDLGFGATRGAQMLSLMLFLGVVSRIGSGFVADAIGGMATLLIGSMMQGLALVLYLYFDGLISLFVVSGVFGLFQGAALCRCMRVICRELMPPREAGAKIGLVVSATIVRHGVWRLFLRSDFRPDKLLPNGVFKRGAVERAQPRRGVLPDLAPK